MDLPITAWLILTGTVVVTVYAIISNFDKFLSWLGLKSVAKLNPKDLPESSPLKETLDSINEKLDDGLKNISTNDKKSQSILKKINSRMLRIEIRNAIVDDLGVHVVSELYDEYSEMGDNGFIKLKYREYLREKGCQDEIDAHFKFMNGKR